MLPNKTLNILFDNDSIKIDLYNNPLADYVHSKFKHLKNVPLHFNDTDIYFNPAVNDFEVAAARISAYASNLNVTIDAAKLADRQYLNYLHEVYEKNFDGSEPWLKFHEHIHIIEKIAANIKPDPLVSINYRTLAGQTEKPFQREYYTYATTTVKKNQCFLKWQELGKTPYQYYANKESNNITRLCELAKPWITLRPSLHIACEDIDYLNGIKLDAFNSWFAEYKDSWCQHWNITDWDSTDEFKVIPIGETNADRLVNNIKNNNLPIKITQ